MKIMPMPADWIAEHTSDAAWRRAVLAAFRVPAHMRYPPTSIIVDMTMPDDRIALATTSGDTVRMTNIRPEKD